MDVSRRRKRKEAIEQDLREVRNSLKGNQSSFWSIVRFFREDTWGLLREGSFRYPTPFSLSLFWRITFPPPSIQRRVENSLSGLPMLLKMFFFLIIVADSEELFGNIRAALPALDYTAERYTPIERDSCCYGGLDSST